MYRKLQREIKLLGNCMQVSEWVGEGDCDEGGSLALKALCMYTHPHPLALALPVKKGEGRWATPSTFARCEGESNANIGSPKSSNSRCSGADK